MKTIREMQSEALRSIELSDLVDRAQELREQIRELQSEYDDIVGEFKKEGVGEYRGGEKSMFIYDYEKTTFDWESIARHFNPSRQLMTAHRTRKQIRSHAIRKKSKQIQEAA